MFQGSGEEGDHKDASKGIPVPWGRLSRWPTGDKKAPSEKVVLGWWVLS